MARKRFTERQALECAIRQGAVIPCFRCKIPFTPETIRTAEREHIHEVVLDGPDTVEACAYSHGDCHSLITNGTAATSAGSSKHKAAKIRPARTEKFIVQKRERRLTADRVSIPTRRCRGCGEIPGACTCKPRPVFRKLGRR